MEGKRSYHALEDDTATVSTVGRITYASS